jgi:hypothetical protein
VIVTVSVPVFVSVAVCVVFWPTATFAKVRFAGLICTVSCGVGLAFDVLANPAQPLTPTPLHATTASSPASAHPLLAFPLSSFSAVPLVAFALAIIFPFGLFVREADYGFDSCKKYWLDVQLRDRRSPVPLNIILTRTFSPVFFL